MSIMKKSKKEDAVSPVVGVMLMLVVTIIIAAVVAAFASGIATQTEPASTSIIKLDDFTMGTLDYTADYSGSSPVYTFVEYSNGHSTTATNPNYAPYIMKFSHNGGDKLRVDGLTLVMNYNAATYSVPFNTYVDSEYWSAGQTITLDQAEKMGEYSTDDPLEADNGGRKLFFGLTQQNVGYQESTIDWSITDISGNVIASGTFEC